MNDRSGHDERNGHAAEARPHAAVGKRLQMHEFWSRPPFELASSCSRVACPIHGRTAQFEMKGGAAQVWFCCDVLLSLVRELSEVG